MSSHPSSRSTSIHPPISRTPSQNFNPLPSSAVAVAGDHPTKLSQKLRHMFDTAKYANFKVNVIIEELSNVPQLEGEFAVRWKFQGRKPKGKEEELLQPSSRVVTPKPSLPNIKLSSSLRSAPSNLSLTSGSVPPPVPSYPNLGRGMHPPPPMARQGKSYTLPPQADKAGPSRVPSMTAIRPEKKVTDPTPLRQSIRADEDPTPLSTPLAYSPETFMDEPEPEAAEESGLIMKPRSSSGRTLPIGVEPMSRLSVPMPKPAGTMAPPPSYFNMERTASHSSTSTDLTPSLGASRQPSIMTYTTSSASTSSLGSTLVEPNSPHRRNLSGHPLKTPDSSHRKGETPNRALKNHIAVWSYEITHTIKIPLLKPVTHGQGTATPSLFKPTVHPKVQVPILGNGPMSDSGLRLSVEQVPTTKKSDGSATPEKSVFGVVDIDLAPFAGKGRVQRRFLLRGSRTNAVVKLNIDMRWVGGEREWIPPSMKEGHHVTGIRDLTSAAVDEKVHGDLDLAKTSSNSSSNSSLASRNTFSNLSMLSTHSLSRNVSKVSLLQPPQNQYKSYEHHLLRPTDATHRPEASRRATAIDTSDKPGRLERTANLFRSTHHHHHHHSHHFLNRNQDELTTPRAGPHELPPELIIESVFNPRPANENGPFTYIPYEVDLTDLPMEEEVLEIVQGQAEAEADGEAGKEASRWRRMRAKVQRDKERRERERSGRVGVVS